MVKIEHKNAVKNYKKYIKWKELKIDLRSRRVYCCLKEINISPKEYKILEFLMQNPRTVFSREEIISSVWDKKTNINSRAIDVHVRRLRKALNYDNFCKLGIRTARSFGYSIDHIK